MIYTIFGIGPLRLVLLLVFWGGLIVLAVFLIRSLFREHDKKGSGNYQPSAREILDQRYARGDISREEYELMKKDISGPPQ